MPTPTPEVERPCRVCGAESLPIRRLCRPCFRDSNRSYQQAYYQSNKNRTVYNPEYAKEYRRKNKERIAQKQAAYGKTDRAKTLRREQAVRHASKISEYQSRYREVNLKRKQAYLKNYQASNKETLAAKARERDRAYRKRISEAKAMLKLIEAETNPQENPS